MSPAADKIRRARCAVDDVMLELFNPQIVEGAPHSRIVGIASDCPEHSLHAARRIAALQRTDAGLHMCLAVASAALEVSRALLDRMRDDGIDDGESALRSCAQDADLVVEAALRARAILADRLPVPSECGQSPAPDASIRAQQ
ncbi:hypothetical protein [Variovorax sp. YR216]|uniref:hypothetical protein n=1 Tax=Variovorax sp. YR216 TaxID=1882828 RepID=UPI00089A5132|nr:hypothetical protein [Variovorax sp. YR216]SEB04401.1 hypothetical protein SAMN05444680_10671 [Variovorax sp. YR216]